MASIPPPPPPSDPPPPPLPPPPPTGGWGSNEMPSTASDLPWENRERIGFVEALVETTKLFLLTPTAAWSRTPATGGIAHPLLYGLILSVLGMVASSIWNLLFGAAMIPFLGGEQAAQSAGQTVVMVIFSPVLAAIGLFVMTAILHVCLMLVGGLDKSTAGFEGTFRLVGYGSAVDVVQLVPFLGGVVAVVWFGFQFVIGAGKIHGTSQGKAIVAYLLPVLLCCGCAVAVAMAGGLALLGAAAAQ